MKNLREEVKIKGHGVLSDIFDDVIKASYNITDDEYDYIAGEATDEELDFFVGGLNGVKATFTTRRLALEIRNKYLKLKNDGESKE